MQSILIAEADDQALRARGDELLLDGFEVHTASTQSRAKAQLAHTRPDALLLGLVDNTAASLALLRSLREGTIPGAEAQIPVLAVGADTDLGAARFYQAGADIVVPRASSPMLIKGALDALAARSDSKQQRRVLRSGRLTVDCDARVASIDDMALRLTRLEFDLLQTLASEPHRTFANRSWFGTCGATTPRSPRSDARSTLTPTACAKSSGPPVPTSSSRPYVASGTDSLASAAT